MGFYGTFWNRVGIIALYYVCSLCAGSEVNEKQQQVAGSSGNCRKLRLFGVNLECQLADDDQVPNDQSPMFYQEHDQYYHYQQHLYSNYYNHMVHQFTSILN